MSAIKKKRHKWDMSLWEKEKHATCYECGCVKEMQAYIGPVYYSPNDMNNFEVTAPDCDEIKKRAANV